MSHARVVSWSLAFAGLLLVWSGTTARSQATQAPVQPNNTLPNPYKTDTGWAKMPQGRKWGSTSAVEIDRDGVSIWVAERCGANNCLTSDLPSVLKFDVNGNMVKAFGAGLIVSPHGIFVDRDGNVWVTDCYCTVGGGRGRGGRADSAGRAGGRADSAAGARAAAPPADQPPRGHQVFKFSPDGKLLLTMGKAGGGRDSSFFWQPNDVLVTPDGTIFVSEGHSSAPGGVARVLKFSADGKLLQTWGQLGAGPDDLNQPHALAMDSQGRLFVGDRGNNRIKIFSQDGKLLETWYQFSRPSGIYIDKTDNIYVADSESGSVDPPHGAWKRGIRIGSAKFGTVNAFIPDPNENATGTSAAEGVAVDSRGNIYGAEVGPRALKRYHKP